MEKKLYSGAAVTYAVSHAVCDLGCGYILYKMYAEGALEEYSSAGLFLLYGILAFGLQFVFGLICDLCDKNGRIMSMVGLTLVAVGMLIGGEVPYLTVVSIGIGSAMLRVGGGIDSLVATHGMTRAGMFLSTGAPGLALGIYLGGKEELSAHAITAALIFCAAAVVLYTGPERYDIEPPSYGGKKYNRPLLGGVWPVVLLFAAALLCAYRGELMPSLEKEGLIGALLPACAIFGGRLVGGVLADLLGARRVAVVALPLSLACGLLSGKSGIFLLGGLALLNMAAPVVLVSLAHRLRGFEGFAFGLASLALELGTLFAYLTPAEGGAPVWLAPLLALASVAAIALSVGNYKYEKEEV